MGQQNVVVELKGWKILPQICYDLRFPVWSRNTGDKEGNGLYDMAFYIASWPASRIAAWDILLKARAVENLSYVLGVNRTGTDGNDISYNGHSGVYDFLGRPLAFSEDKEETLYAELDFQRLAEFRKAFPAWKDADKFRMER